MPYATAARLASRRLAAARTPTHTTTAPRSDATPAVTIGANEVGGSDGGRGGEGEGGGGGGRGQKAIITAHGVAGGEPGGGCLGMGGG